jgi:hypothetical protein
LISAGGFGSVQGPKRAFSGLGMLTLPPASDVVLIPTDSYTLVFYIVDGLMVAQVGEGISKATHMVVGRGKGGPMHG